MLEDRRNTNTRSRSNNFVSIVMPALNERDFILAAIESIVPKGISYEVIVADGGSSDGTCELINEYMKSNPNVRLIENKKRIPAAGVNKAVICANELSNIIIRADCHALYPKNFVSICVAELQRSNASSVVVPMKTIGCGCIQSAVAEAQNSYFGNGGAAHRNVGSSRFVDHGHHAAFIRSDFIDVGGYREDMRCNEDAEYDLRLAKAGGKIWLSNSATIIYFPRKSLARLFVQYYNFGIGRAYTSFLHSGTIKVRHLLPILSQIFLILASLASAINSFFFFITLLYIAPLAFWFIARAIVERKSCLALSGAAAFIMHQAWAAGFIKQSILLALRKIRGTHYLDK